MSELSEEEQKYFESGGNAEITESETESSAPEEEAKAEEQVEEQAEEQVEATTEEEAPAKVVPPKMVDKRALDEARAHNREMRAKFAQLEASHKEAMARLQEFQQRLDPGAQKPAFEDNPAEHLRLEVTETKKQLQEFRSKQETEAQMNQFTQWYQGQAQAFASQQNDFFDAYAAYNKTRFDQLVNQGLAEDQAKQRLRYEEMQLASTAVQLGQNPAQLLYQLAQSRGYRPAQLQAEKNQGTVSAPAKIEQIRRGQEASKPLSSIGGGGQVENLTWDYVASAPDDEFLAMWSKMEKAEQARR